jgi:V8-like Glu-specific endopeptidase
LTETECGKNGNTDPTFVINDNSPGHWPWMASLGIVNEKNQWQHQCGATLISHHHFLTASHCVKEGVKKG